MIIADDVRKEIRYVLFSLLTGILLLVGIYSFGQFAASYERSHPEGVGSVLGSVGYVVVSLLILPLFGSQFPPLWLLIGTALFDVWWLSLPVYLLTWIWRHRRTRAVQH